MQKSCPVLVKFNPVELSRLNAASTLVQSNRSAFIRNAVERAVSAALEKAANPEAPK